jgi:hypothetical protein
MMHTKWKKTILIAVPLVVLGSVAAFAAEGQSSNKLASATAPATSNVKSSAISSQVVSTQSLTPDELQALDTAKPAPAPATTASTTTSTSTAGFSSSGTDQSLIDANDPFSVQNSNTATASTGNAGTSTGGTATTGATAATGGTFSLDLVKNLDITSNTTQGVLKLHFTSGDDGKIKLEGDLGGRKIALEGDMAEQILNKVMQSMNLSDALTASLNGQSANLDPNVLQSLETLHVDLKDGRKIDTNAPGHGNAPKAQGRHDNGKHKGQEKEQGKGHGKKGED